ncbi:MAG TPA: PTS sugar transporter subunit IIA [Usitatibacteraceae bacterium]|jgi:PTS system nitrogen regulatory IIA component|nr:PTS sugar transporter subunit IIA [Burkholderiales bacterium]MBX3714395.1 PTS sugar transporter subunit IIA [Burkholderiales bacterium]MCL4687976.1 PTS sugar transporter subunit IIA [Burkholderiales bacterium]HQY46193.1 PTS sugar transporter subunit IIA [Usitatibacteraceae bacterium]
MNRLTPLLPAAHVVLDLDVSSKKRLFEQIGLLFENSRQVPRARVFDCLFDREKLGSTGLGYGVAIPHGRLKNLKDTLCAFVRTQAPVPFESPDGQPVRLVLAMVVPEHATEQHLELLSDLAQMFSDPGLRDQLLAAGDVDAAHRLLTQWSPYAPPQRTAAL